MQNEFPILSNIISPKTIEEFWKEWPNTHLVTNGDLRRLPKFFQSEELKNLEYLLTNYEGDIVLNRGISNYAFPTRVKKGDAVSLIDFGCVIQFMNIAKIIPNSTEFIEDLAKDFGILPKFFHMALFASANGENEGLGVHFDGTDVLVVQLQGEKRFKIAPSPIKYPCGYQFSLDNLLKLEDTHFSFMAETGIPETPQKLETILMKPGTVLLLPRGYWHQTFSSSDSISINIVMKTNNAADIVVPYLRNLLLQNISWRKPLYQLTTQTEHLENLLKKLPGIAKSMKVMDLMAGNGDPKKRFLQIRKDTRVFKISGITFQKKDIGNGKIEVTIDKSGIRSKYMGSWTSTRFKLPKEAGPILQWIQDFPSGTFFFEDLEKKFPEFEESTLVSLISLLDDQKVVKILFFPSFPNV